MEIDTHLDDDTYIRTSGEVEMGCSRSRPGAVETPAQPPAGLAGDRQRHPLDGKTFADIIMRFMETHPEGPTMEQGELLEYIVNHQSTPVDRGDTKSNKTPVQYASQHRLVIWLMFIIHRLNVVSQPELLEDARRDMNVVDRRRRIDKTSAEQRKHDQVTKLLMAPDTATFLSGHFRATNQTDQGLTDAFKVLSETVPDASDIPDEPPALGAWMMARNFAELTIEAYGGGLWGLFTSCLKLAEIVRRWASRSEERLAWKAFAEAHRGMVESARALNTLADDMGIGLPATNSNTIKTSLKEWIASVQGVVECLCGSVEAAIANPAAIRSRELNKLMARSTAEVLEKRAHMNVMLDTSRQLCVDNARITWLERIVKRFLKLDLDLAASLGTLNNTEMSQDEIDEALGTVLTKYRINRAEGGDGNSDAPTAPGAAPGAASLDAPGAGNTARAPTVTVPVSAADVATAFALSAATTATPGAGNARGEAFGHAAPSPAGSGGGTDRATPSANGGGVAVY